jgi:hypothetical protein
MMIIIIIGASSKLQKASNQSALSRYANWGIWKHSVSSRDMPQEEGLLVCTRRVSQEKNKIRLSIWGGEKKIGGRALPTKPRIFVFWFVIEYIVA